MPKTVRFLVHEFLKALPATLFFIVVFHLALLVIHLDEESFGITPGRSATATIGALILGKLNLLLNESRLANLFSGHPLAIATLWKTLLYTILATLALFCEEMAPIVLHQQGLEPAWHQYRAEIVWPRFWANHILLVMWVLVYSAASELITAIGKDRILLLFFGWSPGSGRPGSIAPNQRRREPER